jgi:GTP-binding protein EngB required for normal cell division
LPFLVSTAPRDKFLSFWEDRDERNLLAIFRALQFAHAYSVIGVAAPTSDPAAPRELREGASQAASDALAATRKVTDASVSHVGRVAAVARAAACAVDAALAGSRSSEAASDLIDAATMAVEPRVRGALLAAIDREVKQLAEGGDAREYLRAPLWPAPPTSVTRLCARFLDVLESFGRDFDYWAGWFRGRWEGVALDVELLAKSAVIPSEVEAQGAGKVNAYLKSLATATRPLNRVRIILIGHGGSGKTSLIRALYGEAVIPGSEPMTPGIAIREWAVPDTPIIADLWDFGGQVMAHATHQFFLRERCLYVLVLNGREEISANEQAEYWLEHVRAFGRNASVLIVANKLDQVPVNLDMENLRRKYKNIRGFYPVSCVQRAGRYRSEWECLVRDLVSTIKDAGTHQVLFTQAHFAILEDLRRRAVGKDFLGTGEYAGICAAHGVQKGEGQDSEWLLDLLDKLGIILHFPKITSLSEYLLNPRWLTYGIYTLMYSEEVRRERGRIAEEHVFEILQEGVIDNIGNKLNFPREKCRFIVEAMEQFQLCYRLPSEHASDILIVPSLLDPSSPKLHFNFDDAMRFDFDFIGLLPRHIITSLIVRRHGEIASGVVWQNGAQFVSSEWAAEALVQADYHDRRLSLAVRGENASRYFAILHDEIVQTVKRMPDVLYDEWVVLPARESHRHVLDAGRVRRAPFRDLLALEDAGNAEYISAHGVFSLSELLKIMPKGGREAERRKDLSAAGLQDLQIQSSRGGLWLSGSFFLLVAVVSISTVAGVGYWLGPLLFVPAVVAGIVLLALVSVLTLRQMLSISEKGFLSVIRETFRYLPGRPRTKRGAAPRLPRREEAAGSGD